MLKVRCQKRRQSPLSARGPADRSSRATRRGGLARSCSRPLRERGADPADVGLRPADRRARRAPPGPVTTNEKLPSKRSITSRPEPAMGELEHGRVASGGEHVVEREREHNLLAGVELASAFVVHPGGRDDDRPVLLVVDVDAGGWIGDVDREQDACLKRHALVLRSVRQPFAVPRSPSTPRRSAPRRLRLPVPAGPAPTPEDHDRS